jgi:hypothetical protein
MFLKININLLSTFIGFPPFYGKFDALPYTPTSVKLLAGVVPFTPTTPGLLLITFAANNKIE